MPGRTSILVLFHDFLSLARASVGTPRNLLVSQLGHDEKGRAAAEEEGGGGEDEEQGGAQGLAQAVKITFQVEHSDLLFIHFTVKH